MSSYLADVKNSRAFEAVRELVPHDICPFLYYNLTPYIFTIAKGGWFDWVAADQDVNFRKPIDEEDFHRKRVNSLYRNEVLVRCPHPCAKIVAGVGLWGKRQIKVRIMHRAAKCPADHEVGDEFTADRKASGDNAIRFNAKFPLALYASLAGEAYNPSGNDCCFGSNMEIDISKILFPCRYHRKKRVFTHRFLPGGFCWHVFGLIYPHILAIMYNATVERELTLKHPGMTGDITLVIRKVRYGRHLALERVKSILNRFLSAAFYPVDFVDYDIEISVLEKDDGGCSLRRGEKYMVNMRGQEFLCPASAHALYPYMILESRGYRFGWDRRNQSNSVPCPDCVGAIYAVGKRKREAA